MTPAMTAKMNASSLNPADHAPRPPEPVLATSAKGPPTPMAIATSSRATTRTNAAIAQPRPTSRALIVDICPRASSVSRNTTLLSVFALGPPFGAKRASGGIKRARGSWPGASAPCAQAVHLCSTCNKSRQVRDLELCDLELCVPRGTSSRCARLQARRCRLPAPEIPGRAAACSVASSASRIPRPSRTSAGAHQALADFWY